MKNAKNLWFHLLLPVILVFTLLWLALAAFVLRREEQQV